MWSANRANSGFTFIELLVTTALGLVMLGGVLAAYGSLATRQARAESAKDIITVLRVAQNRSRSGDKPAANCTNLDGYRVYAAQNTQDFYLVARCDGADKADERMVYHLREQEYFLTDFSVIFPVQSGPIIGAPETVRLSRLDETTTPYEFVITVSGVVEDHGIISL